MDLNEQTAVVREVDREYMDEGGSTRHWVQALNRAGYCIAPLDTHPTEPDPSIPSPDTT